MERMHGIDAFSIYGETSTSTFATLKVAIYAPVDPSKVPDFEEIREFVKSQIERFGGAVTGMRIVRVPFDLHHPVWVADPDYSPDDHIYHTALPAPGDKGQLCEFLSDLMGRPLDPGRPLWEVWIVEGLEASRIAVAIKVHHALADGKTVATLLARAHSGSRPRGTASPGTEAEPIPGKLRLIGDAVIDLFKTYTDELPRFFREVRQVRREQADDGHDAESEEPLPKAPLTVLTRAGSSRYRVYRYETFSLPAFKSLAKRFDCTINTLVLAVCSEALKRYLREVDTLPTTTLLAAMPVGEPGSSLGPTRLHHHPAHNSVAVAMLPLHQDIEDFDERVQAIKQSSKAAVERVHHAEGRRFDNLLEFLPGGVVRSVMGLLQVRLRRGANPPANVVISNVRGPRKPLYALDGRLEMVELLSTGNITDAGHLNITVWSYVDNLCFSFYMRKGVLPDPDKLTGYVREVVTELEKRVVTELEKQVPSGPASPHAG